MILISNWSFRSMSLTGKLLAVTLLIAGVSVAAITLLTCSTTTDTLHGLERKRVAESVRSEARILQATINMVKSDMTMLAAVGAGRLLEEHSEPSADGVQAVADQFAMLMQERPAYRQIKMFVNRIAVPRALISTRIDNVVRTLVDPAVASLEYGALLTEKQGLIYFNGHTGSLNEEATGEKCLFLSMPILGKDNATVAVIAVIVSIDQVFRSLGHPQDDIAYWVADSTGEYLYQSRPQALKGYPHEPANAIRDFNLRESWDRLLLGKQLQLVVDFPAIAMMLGIQRVTLDVGEEKGYGNTLIIGGIKSLLDLDIHIAALQRQLAMVVVGVGILMVLTLFVATGRLLRPINDLTKVANRIASGDQDIVIPTSNADEIGVLARAMMRMADKLRKAGENSEQTAMGQMASMIAHDLRNALSSVKMNLQILESHHREEGESQRDNCEIALGQVRYMETILNDMLTFARPGTAEFDWVDLGDALRIASLSLLPEITRKSIDLRMEEGQKLPTVMADRNKLLQLFQNILTNAIYAVPEWGQIAIRTRCILHESQPTVEVRVEDNGPGISPQIVDRIFEPFFTTSARGTGLGLAIVQRIVKQHKGKVYLDTTGSEGTTMVVLLPLAQ